ncbi:putative drug exporter of the RND superfamily [Oceanobacillus limi]|uniref:Putative drug exporter of the RND superfamily n=1 Tax=Oceanobacillus limi TaxID=930131 RepID=A0A1H9YGU7_9BACI|nr:MMPL family transporter [Oceanobacillus limi]SES68165.1 putative drug exporter of the RND superfamily [Oceanobacillus limi]
MKQIIRFRWIIAAAWILVAVGLFILAPNLQELVREKGQIAAPEDSPSVEAQQLIESMSDERTDDLASSVLVFHDEAGLDQSDQDEIVKAIELLEENENQLAISDILKFTDDPAIEDQTVSEDGTTIIVPFQVSMANQEIDESREKIYNTIDAIQVDHYLTGETYISQDIITNSEEGLKKTEIITVGLILIILFIVFKSFVAPFIPLLTVGISYLAAQGIVSILADTIDFPLSTFTQIFMVAVMFGIGTDYCILLISRFKEEVAKQDSIKDAVLTTYQSGGKTIFFAGLAVLIGFSTIGLSTFSLYQSAVAVAIGVAVVLIALTTLVPFFLVVLGKKLFWPFDKNVSHKESKIWGAAGNLAWGRPLIALLIVAVITVPALLSYDGDKSYNSLEEIGDEYDSVQGFNYISDSFGPGQTMPTTIVMEAEDVVDTAEEFQQIESISQSIAKLEGVKEVRSATRPTGSIIEDFLVDNFTGQLSDGIGQSTDGIQEIEEGLREASNELNDAQPQLQDAQDGVDQLMTGTQEANNGIGEIQQALQQIHDGIESGALGADEIKTNLQTIKDNLDQSIAANKQLLDGYQAIADGLQDFGSDNSINPDDLDAMIQTLEGSKSNIDQMYETAIDATPELQQDEAFVTAYQTAIGQTDGVIDGIKQIKEELAKLAEAQRVLQDQVIAPLGELNGGLKQSIAGQEQLSNGLAELIEGVDELQSGLHQAANGQSEVINNFPGLQEGLTDIHNGQKELKTAFADMQDQLVELSDGLHEGAEGLHQIDDGLTEVESYLSEFETDKTNPAVVIPEEAMDNEDFMEGANMYLSDDKKVVTFDVVLDYNPYSTEALMMVDTIKEKADEAKKDTIFESSDPKLGGISSTNNDLQNVSDADYSRTVIFMIAGIFIILIILLKSLIMPLYLIGSLVVTYFTSMAFSELIFVNILGYDGLTWAVPFFAFVMLTALGIDYSIFLMDRFNEYRDVSIKEAMLTAMKNMGTVIISAAVILGGTFGAMLPSGVLSILQIATVVLIGLFLYALVMLPLFIPIMVRLFGNANWWPFKRK